MAKYLENKYIDLTTVENATMQEDGFSDFRFDNIELFPLLYQTGYLTITDFNEETQDYKLNYPNTEIRKSFSKFLTNSYSDIQRVFDNSIHQLLIRYLYDGDLNKFFELLRGYLHRIDFSLSSKITEYYFEFAVTNIINMLGMKCEHEVHTANGIIDTVIFTPKRIFVIEFKVDKPVEDALYQIERKDYALKYANDGREIVKAGVVFSREERNIIHLI